jgi:hypothetical protein
VVDYLAIDDLGILLPARSGVVVTDAELEFEVPGLVAAQGRKIAVGRVHIQRDNIGRLDSFALRSG